ncbi:hypothetical protein F5I97DRAFT_1928664 [Phlebopus sp. FC_14]|nr:hypothetical protein F5I97DRAFT_1928664 [Phlebopus sp. FC_14]
MFGSLFSLFSALLLAVSYLVSAAPVQPVELLVWSPTITSPKLGDVWLTGSTQNVTWLIDDIPDEKKNSTGLLLLGYFANNSENLDIKHPLASGFPIAWGWVDITVPTNLTRRDNYTVVLFGDSGNASPAFTIKPNATRASN